MFSSWFGFTLTEAAMVLISGICVYIAILVYARIVGLRSFSKMSASDFAMTVAVGSLFASAISSPSPTVGIALVALFVLFGGQWFFAYIRRKSSTVRRLLENKPVLLMEDGRMIEENLNAANVTKEDVMAKLREANVLKLKHVKAVVFETTGDISVLHSRDAGLEVDCELLSEVAGGRPSTCEN